MGSNKKYNVIWKLVQVHYDAQMCLKQGGLTYLGILKIF